MTVRIVLFLCFVVPEPLAKGVEDIFKVKPVDGEQGRLEVGYWEVTFYQLKRPLTGWVAVFPDEGRAGQIYLFEAHRDQHTK